MEHNVSIFRGYTKLAGNGQHIVSTSGAIKNKVKDGEKILEEYVKEIVKLDGFYEAGDGFIYKIEKLLDKDNWDNFKKINSHLIEKIRKNGLNE